MAKVTTKFGTRLRSRFSQTVLNPTRTVLLGMVDVDNGSGDAFLNSVSVGTSLEYLLPDGHGAWAILSEDGTHRMAGTFPQHSLPVENDLPSLIAIGELVKATENSHWQELDQIAPTVPDLGKRIQLTAMEQAILRYLPYLEEACARPKAYLKTETARVYVSQARRIPARATSYLAAHTEDWERPTLRSVRPKRVLAEVREDDLDIYENRVAVRLVDRLLRVVQPRILELRKAQRILSDLLDYSTSAGGSHWRAGRICSLWAESVSALQSEKRSRTTLEKLVSIRQRLRALLDSPLYRTISHRADVADELKLTNILATDPIYKHIAILWLAWGRQKSGRQKSARDVFTEYRTFCDAFNRFTLLLVVRALSQFGISLHESDAGTPTGPGCSVRLSRLDLRLSVMENGVIQLYRDSELLVMFAPLPAAINRARSDSELEEWVGFIHEDLQNRATPCHTVVLYLSSMAGASKTLGGEASTRLWTIGNEPSSTGLSNFGLVPVSPWEIDCVERVARCLRWAITGRDLLKFPAGLRASLPADLSRSLLPSWLSLRQDGLFILRRVREGEWRRWELDSIWQRAKQNLDVETAKFDQAVAKQERGRIAPHERKAAAQEVSRQRKVVAEAQRKYEELDVFRQEIVRTLEQSEDSSICPACGSQADLLGGFKPDTRYYEYRCDDCNARWGVRTCSCNQRVPFMEIASPPAASDRSPGWVDRQFGRDVLAIPAGQGSFECSGCGGRL